MGPADVSSLRKGNQAFHVQHIRREGEIQVNCNCDNDNNDSNDDNNNDNNDDNKDDDYNNDDYNDDDINDKNVSKIDNKAVNKNGTFFTKGHCQFFEFAFSITLPLIQSLRERKRTISS